MLLYIKTVNGRFFTIDANPDGDIQAVKQTIEEQEGIPVRDQRLIFAGRVIQGQRTLSRHNIMRQSTLYCVVRQVG